jgi:hypothetical protein
MSSSVVGRGRSADTWSVGVARPIEPDDAPQGARGRIRADDCQRTASPIEELGLVDGPEIERVIRPDRRRHATRDPQPACHVGDVLTDRRSIGGRDGSALDQWLARSSALRRVGPDADPDAEPEDGAGDDEADTAHVAPLGSVVGQ